MSGKHCSTGSRPPSMVPAASISSPAAVRWDSKRCHEVPQRLPSLSGIARTARALEANLEILGPLSDQVATVVADSAERFLARTGHRYDFIFCDPPFDLEVPGITSEQPPRRTSRVGRLTVSGVAKAGRTAAASVSRIKHATAGDCQFALLAPVRSPPDDRPCRFKASCESSRPRYHRRRLGEVVIKHESRRLSGFIQPDHQRSYRSDHAGIEPVRPGHSRHRDLCSEESRASICKDRIDLCALRCWPNTATVCPWKDSTPCWWIMRRAGTPRSSCGG